MRWYPVSAVIQHAVIIWLRAHACMQCQPAAHLKALHARLYEVTYFALDASGILIDGAKTPADLIQAPLELADVALHMHLKFCSESRLHLL